MALFAKKTAAISTTPVAEVQAAVGYTSNAQGPNMIGQYYTYQEGEARNRNASSSIPAGILKQTDGEPLSAQELTDIAAQFNAARATNQTAALNQYLRYEPTTMTPDKMLLIESANYSALEAARLGNVPPYLVGVSTGSYSYQSAQQARADLYIFGVKLYAEAIAATLSMDNVLPRGTYVEFDADEYLEEEYAADKMDQPSEVNIQENTQERIANR